MVAQIPVLTTPRIVLRSFEAADWEAYARMNADPTVRRWLGGALLSRQETWSQMETFLGQWALRGYGMFALSVGGRFAGRVGILHPADWIEPELAWSLAAPFWGQGLATEAAGCVRQWAFDRFGWHRLVSYIVPDNLRSRRVAEKLGASPESTATIRGFQADVWVHRRPGNDAAA
jgi:RimJ/RimL family protein N-acetyltransferase